MNRASRDRDEEVLGLREQLASLRAKLRTLQADRDALDADLEASKRSQVMSLLVVYLVQAWESRLQERITHSYQQQQQYIQVFSCSRSGCCAACLSASQPKSPINPRILCPVVAVVERMTHVFNSDRAAKLSGLAGHPCTQGHTGTIGGLQGHSLMEDLRNKSMIMMQMVSSSERDTALQLAEQRAKRLAQSLQESEAEVTSLAARVQSSVSPSDSAPLPSCQAKARDQASGQQRPSNVNGALLQLLQAWMDHAVVRSVRL